jgi:hypothetical protein
MMWKLHREWNIPAEALIKPRKVTRPRRNSVAAG